VINMSRSGQCSAMYDFKRYLVHQLVRLVITSEIYRWLVQRRTPKYSILCPTTTNPTKCLYYTNIPVIFELQVHSVTATMAWSVIAA
jgi:hypothetical protein